MTRPVTTLSGARIVLNGRNSTDPRPVSDWQRDRMQPGFEPDRWSRADKLVLIRAMLFMASAAVSCLLVMWVWPS